MESFIPCSTLHVLGEGQRCGRLLNKRTGNGCKRHTGKIAIPLLADFIKTTDEYIRTKAISARLRFTHAEAIAPYAAGASTATNNVNEINKLRNAGDVIQLSANIQWILKEIK
jgi:hypothetical protein